MGKIVKPCYYPQKSPLGLEICQFTQGQRLVNRVSHPKAEIILRQQLSREPIYLQKSLS